MRQVTSMFILLLCQNTVTETRVEFILAVVIAEKVWAQEHPYSWQWECKAAHCSHRSEQDARYAFESLSLLIYFCQPGPIPQMPHSFEMCI